MAQFQPGDRVEFYTGEDIAFRADVLKVAKNGRLWIERWFRHMRVGDPKLIREWQDARNATLIYRNGTRSPAQALSHIGVSR